MRNRWSLMAAALCLYSAAGKSDVTLSNCLSRCDGDHKTKMQMCPGQSISVYGNAYVEPSRLKEFQECQSRNADELGVCVSFCRGEARVVPSPSAARSGSNQQPRSRRPRVAPGQPCISYNDNDPKNPPDCDHSKGPPPINRPFGEEPKKRPFGDNPIYVDVDSDCDSLEITVEIRWHRPDGAFDPGRSWKFEPGESLILPGVYTSNPEIWFRAEGDIDSWGGGKYGNWIKLPKKQVQVSNRGAQVVWYLGLTCSS